MKELIENIVRAIVDDSDAVKVNAGQGYIYGGNIWFDAGHSLLNTGGGIFEVTGFLPMKDNYEDHRTQLQILSFGTNES